MSDEYIAIQNLHTRAMELADAAFAARAQGRHDDSITLFAQAFELESQASIKAAAANVPEPTRSILHRSAATLALDCNKLKAADQLVTSALSTMPSPTIAQELRELRDTIRKNSNMNIEDSSEQPVTKVQTVGEGRFLLLSSITEGGQAAVWKAKEIPNPKRELAVKMVRCRPENVRKGNPSIEDIFLSEGRTWSEFQKSPHVVQLYYSFRDLYVENGIDMLALGFVMEYSPIGDLSAYLRDKQFHPHGKKQLRDFLLNIGQAVKAGHDKDIVHGDIKARNVLLFNEAGAISPKLMDFGMSLTTDIRRDKWGGTPEYMAPELFDHSAPTKESDVYSLGVLFYEIVTGRLPYNLQAKDRESRWRDYGNAHLNGGADFTSLGPALDKEFSQLVRDMMARDPHKRIKLAKVIALLRVHQEQEIRATSFNPENDAAISPRTYRWNPTVHLALGNHLFYYLIKGASPAGDPVWFRNNLQERGIYGYSLYRVLGGFDYVLRVWLKHPYEEEADLIMRTFRDSHGGTYIRFAVDELDLFEKYPIKTLGAADHIFKQILNCRDHDRDAEYAKLQKQGLVLSRFTKDQQFPIRFFLTVHGGSNLSEAQSKYYAHCFTEALRTQDLAKELSIYRGTGDFSFLIKFRVAEFGHFREVYQSFIAKASKIRLDNAPLTSQTYVELDAAGFIESDDGSIIAQVNDAARLETS